MPSHVWIKHLDLIVYILFYKIWYTWSQKHTLSVLKTFISLLLFGSLITYNLYRLRSPIVLAFIIHYLNKHNTLDTVFSILIGPKKNLKTCRQQFFNV